MLKHLLGDLESLRRRFVAQMPALHRRFTDVGVGRMTLVFQIKRGAEMHHFQPLASHWRMGACWKQLMPTGLRPLVSSVRPLHLCLPDGQIQRRSGCGQGDVGVPHGAVVAPMGDGQPAQPCAQKTADLV